jgi:hypothetical protein
MDERSALPDDAHRRVVALLQKIQWSASTVNPRTGFRTDRCPACGGIAPGTFGEAETGHKADCDLARLLAAGGTATDS